MYIQLHFELDIMKVNNMNPDQFQIKQNPPTQIYFGKVLSEQSQHYIYYTRL